MKQYNEDYSITNPLKDFFEKNKKLEQGLETIRVKEIWMDLAGSGVANYTQSIDLRKQTLYVKLNSSIARDYLLTIKSNIILMLNKELGKALIKDIVIH